MSYLTHISRHEDLNYSEDFEEAIARSVKEEELDNESEGEYASSIKISPISHCIFLIIYSLLRSPV
jgi:hypothetical protein